MLEEPVRPELMSAGVRDAVGLDQLSNWRARRISKTIGDVNRAVNGRHVSLGPVDPHGFINCRVEISDGYRPLGNVGALFVTGADDAPSLNSPTSQRQRPAIGPVVPP